MPNVINKIFGVLVFRGGGSAFSVLFAFMVSRYMEADDAADFFFVFNLLVISSVCFRWGMDELIVQRVASSDSGEIDEVAERFVLASQKRILAWLSSSIIMFSIVAIYFGAGSVVFVRWLDILLALLSSAFFSAVCCAARVQQAMGRINYAAFLLNIFMPLSLVCSFFVFLFFELKLAPVRVFSSYFILAFFLYFFVVYRRFGFSFFKSLSDEERAASNKLGFIVLCQQGMLWVAFVVFPFSYGDSLYQAYVVSQKVAGLITLVALAYNFTFSAKFAKLNSLRDYRSLVRIVVFSLIAVGFFSFVLIGLMIFFESWIFDVARIRGQVSGIFVALLFGQLFFSLVSLLSLVLSMCKDYQYLLRAQAISNLTGAILVWWGSLWLPLDVVCLSFLVVYALLGIFLLRRFLLICNGGGHLLT